MDRRRSLTLTVIAALIATGIGIAISYAIHWFPSEASKQARNTDHLYHVLVIACVPIFVLVVTVILYCAWQFHMKPGEELKDGPPIHGNTRLEVFWTVMPAALLMGMLAYSLIVLHNNEKKPAREIRVGVTAQQFAWSFQYPPSVTGGRPVQTTQLYLPVDESVKFEMHSKDVIHAFWIPSFRLQQDVVPGITTSYRATPVKVGTYLVVCNLLCGLGHALMRTQVHVMPQAAFQTWLAGRAAAVSTAGGTP